ncbi:MAG: hypothetical protein JST20_05580 [Bacteroidetes bacterium]|nr:hypothetical protein [Bacteroidota bacterium]
MKNLSRFFAVALVTAIVSYGAVLGQSQEQTAIMRIVNGIPQILVSQSILQSAFEAEYNDGTIISSIVIESTVPPYYYLVGKGANNGDSRTMGILLVYRPSDSSWVIGTTMVAIDIKHACSGNNCVSCDFATNQGQIVGCNCLQKGDPDKPGYCNHGLYQTTTNPGHLGDFY